MSLRSTDVPVGASNLYLRHASAPCLGSGAVGAGGMPCWVPCADVILRHAPLWARQRRRPMPAHPLIVAAAGYLCPGCSGGGGVLFPSLPLSVLPRFTLAHGCHSGGFVTPGQLYHSGGVDALWQLDSPTHSLVVPPSIFSHSGGLATPLLATHSRVNLATPEASHPQSSPRTPEDLSDWFSGWPLDLSLFAGLTPWRPCAPALLAAAKGSFPVLPPPAIASPGSSTLPLSCVPHSSDSP